jgi:hypothetical protein
MYGQNGNSEGHHKAQKYTKINKDIKYTMETHTNICLLICTATVGALQFEMQIYIRVLDSNPSNFVL